MQEKARAFFNELLVRYGHQVVEAELEAEADCLQEWSNAPEGVKYRYHVLAWRKATAVMSLRLLKDGAGVGVTGTLVSHALSEQERLPPELPFNKLVITGAGRTGTTLMLYLMRTFKEAFCWPGEVPGFLAPPLDGVTRCVVVTKSPSDVDSIDMVLSIYPATAVMFMVRDPRDTLCSKVHGRYAYQEYEPDSLTGRVRASLGARQTMAEAGIPFFKVPYEDLVSRPLDIQREIAEVLDIEPSLPFTRYHEVPDLPELNDEFGTPRPMSDASVGQHTRPEHREWMRYLVASYGDEICEVTRAEGYAEDDSWTEEFK